VTGHGAPALPHDAEAFQGQPAGLVSRSLAAVIDVLVVAAILVAAYVGLAAVQFAWNPRSFTFPAPSSVLSIAAAGVLATGYLAIGWWVAGRTYGSAVMGLRVVNRDGRRVRFLPALLRAVICTVFPIGLALCAIDTRGRGLQDMVVRTRVIYDWLSRED